MSGGYIQLQKEGEHQVVIFTFIGPINQDQKDQWNKRVLELKNMFVSEEVRELVWRVSPSRVIRHRKNCCARRRRKRRRNDRFENEGIPTRRAAKDKIPPHLNCALPSRATSS